jgi:hypothetical protein
VASIISAILVEDFAQFIFRLWLPLDNDPKRGLLMQVSDWTTTNNTDGLIIPKSSSFVGFVIPYHIGMLLQSLLQVCSFTMHSRKQYEKSKKGFSYYYLLYCAFTTYYIYNFSVLVKLN